MKPRSTSTLVALEAEISGSGGAADGHQHRLRFLRHLLAIGAGEGHLHPVFGLFHLVHFGPGVGVDASLAKDPGQFLAHVLVFVGDQARQVLDDGDLAAKALEDGAELDPHGAGADHHHGLGYLGQGEDLDVGQDPVRVRFHAGQHAGVGAGGDDHVLGLDNFLLPVGCFDRNGVNSLFRRAGELAIALDDGDLVLAHEEVETLHMLGDDPVLAIQNGLPVESDRAHAFDAVLGGVLEVVIDLGVEEQGLGGNAAHVQAGASQLLFPLDQRDLQPVLPGADGGGISAGSAADDDYVVDCFCHSKLPQYKTLILRDGLSPVPASAVLCHTERVRPHLATLVADFRRYGEQIAVVTHRGNRRFSSTYAQLGELSARCARAYDQAGLRPGDRVLLWGNNSVEWVAAFFGCILRGIVAVPLDAAGSLEFAQRVVAEVEPRLLVGDLVLLQQLHSGIPTLGFAGFSSSLPGPDYPPLPGLSRDTPLQIIFTSGTTAEPKGIVHTQGNVLASLDPLEQEIGKYLRYERFFHPLRILHTLPLSHVFGQFMGLWVPPLLAAEVHYEDRLQAPRLATLMREERISVLAAVPRVLDLLRAYMEAEFPALAQSMAAARGESVAKRWWRFRAVHRRLGFKFWAFVSGGATLPADLESFWTTAGFALIQGYGMTETTALVTLNHPFKIARGSIGKPLPGTGSQDRSRWRDPGAGGFDRRPGMASRPLQPRGEDWLATGDLATRNDAGELVFAGRKSDVIVTCAGLNIHPQDLEAVLRRQPGLRDSLIVAYDSTAGPTPAAVLIPDAGQGDDLLKRAVDNANGELAPFQQIRYWLRWPQAEFPRTSTGKVLRRVVQSWAQQSLASGGAAVENPSDPLLAVLRQLGAANQEIAPSDRLIEDLHLDSLAMVQLQSTLETRFGIELDDAVWAADEDGWRSARLLQRYQPGAVPAGAVPKQSPAHRAKPRQRRLLPL